LVDSDWVHIFLDSSLIHYLEYNDGLVVNIYRFNEKLMKKKTGNINNIVARFPKELAQRALQEIRKMFKVSGITKAELQNSGREVRRDMMKQSYSNLEQKTPSSTLLSRRTSGTVSRQGKRKAYNESVSRIKIFARIENKTIN
jgi:hypothetical protein